MATDRAKDLSAFKSFVDRQLADDPVPTVGEVIARWDAESRSDEEQRNTDDAARKSPAGVEAVESGIQGREALAELRKHNGLSSDARTLQKNPEAWVKRLHALVDLQPIRPNSMDDSRESIYAGRGE